MTVLWFCVFMFGIAMIFSIARYNESNKLFWTLLLAYISGFAITKMLYDNTNGEEQSNTNLTQVCPTQMPTIVGVLPILQKVELKLESKKVTASNSVSKVYTPAMRETTVTLSQVFGRTRDQPIDFFNTS